MYTGIKTVGVWHFLMTNTSLVLSQVLAFRRVSSLPSEHDVIRVSVIVSFRTKISLHVKTHALQHTWVFLFDACRFKHLELGKRHMAACFTLFIFVL